VNRNGLIIVLAVVGLGGNDSGNAPGRGNAAATTPPPLPAIPGQGLSGGEAFLAQNANNSVVGATLASRNLQNAPEAQAVLDRMAGAFAGLRSAHATGRVRSTGVEEGAPLADQTTYELWYRAPDRYRLVVYKKDFDDNLVLEGVAWTDPQTGSTTRWRRSTGVEPEGR
jgi:hypothetical protein